MAELSLQDLKRQNEAAPEVKPEPVQEAVEAAPEPEPEAEDENGETPEAWMQSDEQPSQERKFTGRDIKAAKENLRAKLERQHNAELERVKAELEAARRAPQAPASLPPPPTEEQFNYDQPQYRRAMAEWVAKVAQTSATEVTKTQAELARIEAARKALDQSADQHYERAAALVEKSGIKPELFQDADRRVKTMLDQLYPGEGELVLAQLADAIGEGSEKAMYFVGRNADQIEIVRSLLTQDRAGNKAIAYLAKKAAEFNRVPSERTSKAPAPPAQLRGDSAPASSRALKEEYEKAHKKGDTQAAFDARRKARKAGVDTSNW